VSALSKRLLVLIVGMVLFFWMMGAFEEFSPPLPHSPFLERKNYTIQQILWDPSAFNGRIVIVEGYLVKNVGQYWGETYSLYSADALQDITKSTPHIALSISEKYIKDNLVNENLVAFTFDGLLFQKQLGPYGCPKVTVTGTFRDQGLVTDAPRYFIEVVSITTTMKAQQKVVGSCVGREVRLDAFEE